MTSTWSDAPKTKAPRALDRAHAALDAVKAIGDAFEKDPLAAVAAGGVAKQQLGGMAWTGALAAVSIAESLDRIAGAVERLVDVELGESGDGSGA